MHVQPPWRQTSAGSDRNNLNSNDNGDADPAPVLPTTCAQRTNRGDETQPETTGHDVEVASSNMVEGEGNFVVEADDEQMGDEVASVSSNGGEGGPAAPRVMKKPVMKKPACSRNQPQPELLSESFGRLRVVRGTKQSYVTGFSDNLNNRGLLVVVSEKQSSFHQDLIIQLAKFACKPGLCKEDLKAQRAKLCATAN